MYNILYVYHCHVYHFKCVSVPCVSLYLCLIPIPSHVHHQLFCYPHKVYIRQVCPWQLYREKLCFSIGNYQLPSYPHEVPHQLFCYPQEVCIRIQVARRPPYLLISHSPGQLGKLTRKVTRSSPHCNLRYKFSNKKESDWTGWLKLVSQ